MMGVYRWKTPLRAIRHAEQDLPRDTSRLPRHSQRLEKQPGEVGYVKPGAAAEPRRTTRQGRQDQVQDNERRGRGRRGTR